MIPAIRVIIHLKLQDFGDHYLLGLFIRSDFQAAAQEC